MPTFRVESAALVLITSVCVMVMVWSKGVDNRFYVMAAVVMGISRGWMVSWKYFAEWLWRSFVVFFCCFVLGVNPVRHFTETVLFSFIASSFSDLQHKPTSFLSVEEWILDRSFVATLLGSLLGSVVIPLDWQQPWQQWPSSCVLGVLVMNSLFTITSIVNGEKTQTS
eukprot:TRINITY_DN14400_c0_g1_i1.p2 TRINITY_DN14400_c0_g1~~TRINITY_DN14400_c0_g1_i1.p2  ORF type:complete len:168 (-),score=28.26 TRINITY_DN14400_c0_g1_i1:124-627(-)